MSRVDAVLTNPAGVMAERCAAFVQEGGGIQLGKSDKKARKAEAVQS